MLFKLDCYDDYTRLLSKTIRGGHLDIFEVLIKDDKYSVYKKKLCDDINIKERLINGVLKLGDEKFGLIVLEWFEISDNLPEYDDISDLVYVSDDRYGNNLINKKRDIYYIFSDSNFEEFWSMKELYELCENDNVLNKIIRDLEEMIGRKLEDNEKKYILDSSRRYREYIDNDFGGIINEIKMDDETPDSEGDCYGILYEYLGHRPSKWEVKLLWESLR